jgi:lysophospholipid acyltransferase (LPLAT)-like uncharacterized protein
MKIVLWLIGIVIVGFVGFTWLTLHWTYSTGDRAGYVQKLSRKGVICKTWEGEMAMVTMPGTVAEKFYFSVRDDAVAAQLNATLGRRVRVHYEQHRFIPTSCFGETEYFVTEQRPEQ